MPMSDYMREIRSKVGSRLLEVPAVSIAARDDDNRVLLVRHSEGGQWVTPGGAIEPLQSPADAALREMWEETGLTVELTRLIGVYGGPEFVVRYGNGDETSYVMIVFAARAVTGTLRPDGDEVLEARWFRRDEAAQLDVPVWMPEILRAVFEEHSAAFQPAAWSPDNGTADDRR